MSERPPQIHFRLPSDLKAWVESEAAINGRSVNAELVAMIGWLRTLKEESENEEQKEATQAKKIAEEALRIAKEARDMWNDNALMQGLKKDD